MATTATVGPTDVSDSRQDTRQRLITVAVDLFTRYSFAGTSLQMIADELGFTKAAIYHHFRTREQLLDAVVEPILDRLRAVIAAAEQLRGVHARADHMLNGFAELAVDNRVVAVLAADPAVAQMLRAGIAGASGTAFDNLDRDTLRAHLVETGRRALGLRVQRPKT
jgi:AcrR family transcriptional regulator